MKKNNEYILRLSSFETGIEEKAASLVMVAPFDDEYEFSTIDSNNSLKVKNKKGELLFELNKNSKMISLHKGDTLYIEVSPLEGAKNIAFSVCTSKQTSLLPYEPINVEDVDKYYDKMNKIDDDVDPLKEANISYVKRNQGLYVNCNNPEILKDYSLNKALSRVDVSNQEVFFTFEHNNCITGKFYYGYQVINTGKEDMYVTVKNVGLHLSGAGCWLGEKEWVDFYNLPFKVVNANNFSKEVKETYDLFFGFSNKYPSPNNHPITYKVPAGKYIYVIGGTSSDSYNNINVFNTANQSVEGGCSNGAVLFEVKGQAEAAFYAYKDPSNVSTTNKTHQGYIINLPDEGDKDYGTQYVGYDDECNGVVDCNLTWEFNDSTKEGLLPVKFDNYYADSFENALPYGKIDSKKHTQILTSWITHINPQGSHSAVGTDMTKYITINPEGKEICIDADHYDGNAHLSNIGNWMIDYIENYTFVNYGNKDRKITISMDHNGTIACFVRDQKGNLVEKTIQYYLDFAARQHDGKNIAGIKENFVYELTIPAKNVVQCFVEYNLLANSCGNIVHKVHLK